MPIEQKPTYQVVIEQFVQLSTIEQLVLNTYYALATIMNDLPIKS